MNSAKQTPLRSSSRFLTREGNQQSYDTDASTQRLDRGFHSLFLRLLNSDALANSLRDADAFEWIRVPIRNNTRQYVSATARSMESLCTEEWYLKDPSKRQIPAHASPTREGYFELSRE